MTRVRDFTVPGRSIAYSTGSMVATSHPLASATALRILARGGNAVDAGIAACAVLAVAEPHMTGIGGDCFALLSRGGSADIIAYNGSGHAPAAATAARLRALGVAEITDTSPHAVTIPGAIEAWHRLVTDHGTMPFGELLQPAADYAENGMPLHERVLADVALNIPKLRLSPEHAALYLSGGETPAPGTVYRNPALARTLRAIAEDGPDAFYKGAVAQALASFLKEKGGLHEPADFAARKGDYVEPISADYGGYTVVECPPNGQGVIVLLILRILSHLAKDPAGPLGGWRLHSMTEAARIAFACRDAWLCDPEHNDIDWRAFLDDRYTAEQARRIKPDSVLDLPVEVDLPEHPDTVYLTVVDRDRNAFSLINSLYYFFGSGLYEPSTGVVLHSRGRSFRTEEGHPNAIAPGKRPMHTIIPGMLVKDGRAVMPFGVMGGHYQPVGQALFLTNMIDYGLDLQRALDLPRCFPQIGALWYEASLPAQARDHLSRAGHNMAERVEPLGGGQAIWIDYERGLLAGASDSRKDGCALGL